MANMFRGVCAALLSRDGQVDRTFDQCVHALTLGSGRWAKHLSDQTTHIVAFDWDTVANYFHDREFLLAYHSEHYDIVTWDWIYAYKESALVDVMPCKLHPSQPIGCHLEITKEECSMFRGFMVD